METKTKFNLWYFVLAIWGVFILHEIWSRATQIREIPYSQFQTYLASNRI